MLRHISASRFEIKTQRGHRIASRHTNVGVGVAKNQVAICGESPVERQRPIIGNYPHRTVGIKRLDCYGDCPMALKSGVVGNNNLSASITVPPVYVFVPRR